MELVNKRFQEAKKYRGSFEEDWKECEDFYDGKHWKDQNRSHKNLVFPLVEQEVAALTDAIPGTDVMARKEEHDERAKMLENALQFTYDQNNLYLKESMAIRSAVKTGNGFLYVDYDPDKDNGKGLPVIRFIPWDHVWISKAASELDEASDAHIRFPMKLEELTRRFPNKAEELKQAHSDDTNGSGNTPGLRESKANYGIKNGNKEERFNGEGMKTLEECWLRDYTMIPIPEEDTASEVQLETQEFFKGENPSITRFQDHVKHFQAHDAQEKAIAGEALGIDPASVTPNDIEALKQNDPQVGLVLVMIEDHKKMHEKYHELNPKGEKPKYEENLRLISKVGDVLLYDGPAPVEDGKVPLVPYYCYKGDSIYGVGEIKNILAPQKSFNEMDHAEYVGLHLNTNSGYVMDNNCGIKPESITNKPGQVFVKNPGTQFSRIEPGQISPQLGSRKSNDQQAMQIITGMNEASQGRASGGITAARAIERLQSQTNGRFRLKSSYNTMYSKKRLGELVASRIVKYWTTERYMRLADKATGQNQTVLYSPDDVKDLEYDIRCVPGPLAGADKEAIYDLFTAFVEKGLITPKMFFTVVDVPYKSKIIEEIDANDQMKMALQQLTLQNQQLQQILAQTQGHLKKEEHQEPQGSATTEEAQESNMAQPQPEQMMPGQQQ